MTPNQQRYFDQGRRAFRIGLARDVLETLYGFGTEEWCAANLGWLAAAERER